MFRSTRIRARKGKRHPVTDKLTTKEIDVETCLNDLLGVNEADIKMLQRESLKEWRFKFAGMAMRGLLPMMDIATKEDVKDLTKASVNMADLLIVELIESAKVHGLD